MNPYSHDPQRLPYQSKIADTTKTAPEQAYQHDPPTARSFAPPPSRARPNRAKKKENTRERIPANVADPNKFSF
jgi:hypothetical protein